MRCDTLISLTVDFTSDSAINVREEERQKLAEGRPTTRPQSSRPRRETTWHVWCSVVVPWGSKQAFATPCFASAVAVGSSWLASHRHMKPLLFESLASRARPAAAGMPTCVCPGQRSNGCFSIREGERETQVRPQPRRNSYTPLDEITRSTGPGLRLLRSAR